MAYLTHTETTELLATLVISVDPRRVAYEGLSEADRTVMCEQAAQDIDGCRWNGRREDDDQAHAFPRVYDGGGVVELRADPGPPPTVAASDWTTAGVPIEIRHAAALQAGKRALAALGQDRTALAREQAAAGITSQQAGGRGISVDATIAGTGWAVLDPDAQKIAQPLRRMGGNAE